MPVPTAITDLSTTIASNSPAGGDSPGVLDDHVRALAGFIASIMANSGNGWTSPYLPLSGGGTAAGTVNFSGTLQAGGIEVGFRKLPAGSVTTGAIAAADSGKCIYATAGVTIPNSTFAQGDVVVIQNTTGSSITITKSITTAYNTANGAALGATFTLTARGRMAVLFNSGTECYVSGNV